MSSSYTSTSTAYTPTSLASLNGINGKNTGSTTIYTVPTGKTFLPKFFTINLSTVSGGGLTPTVKIKNNTTSLDLIGAQTLVGLTIAGYTYNLAVNTVGATPGCAAGDVIQIEVTSGSNYTTYTIDVHVFGLLI